MSRGLPAPAKTSQTPTIARNQQKTLKSAKIIKNQPKSTKIIKINQNHEKSTKINQNSAIMGVWDALPAPGGPGTSQTPIIASLRRALPGCRGCPGRPPGPPNQPKFGYYGGLGSFCQEMRLAMVVDPRSTTIASCISRPKHPRPP